MTGWDALFIASCCVLAAALAAVLIEIERRDRPGKPNHAHEPHWWERTR